MELEQIFRKIEKLNEQSYQYHLKKLFESTDAKEIAQHIDALINAKGQQGETIIQDQNVIKALNDFKQNPARSDFANNLKKLLGVKGKDEGGGGNEWGAADQERKVVLQDVNDSLKANEGAGDDDTGGGNGSNNNGGDDSDDTDNAQQEQTPEGQQENNEQENQQTEQNNQSVIPESVKALQKKANVGAVSPDDIKAILSDQSKAEEFIKFLGEKGFNDIKGLEYAAETLKQQPQKSQNSTSKEQLQSSSTQQAENNQVTDATNVKVGDAENAYSNKKWGMYINALVQVVNDKQGLLDVAQALINQANKMQ